MIQSERGFKLNYIDANKYYLKQICTRYNVDCKEMKRYAATIWKCNSSIKPFVVGGGDQVMHGKDLVEQLQYIRYDRHDLKMLERAASYLAMTSMLYPIVKEAVIEVQNVFGEAADRYLGIYERFYGYMGENQLHRNMVADYSRSQLYVIRQEALVAFGIVFDEMTLPKVVDHCKANKTACQETENLEERRVTEEYLCMC